MSAAVALALVTAGVSVAVPALAATAPAADVTAPAADVCVGVDPMGAATPTGSSDGYTLFVSGDAVLANSELEGTLAVGGTARFGDPRGNGNLQYPVFHGGVGGNADYSVPTVEGEPNRVLIQRFASSDKIVQVQSRGATGRNVAGAKIADPSVPDGYTFGPQFGGPGTTYFPEGGGNQSPQIESAVQPWTTRAAAQQSWGLTGDVLSHFPVDAGAEAIAAFTGWKPVSAPTGEDQVVALDPTGPSTLPLSAFAGIGKFGLSGYSAASFLVISVSPADVVDGRVTLPSLAYAGTQAPQNAAIGHVLFDFRAISGDVIVSSPNEPVRGSIYAPSAHIVFPAESEGGREFEGQLIARSFTALQGGKEMHTNLFQGRFPCVAVEAEEGTFHLRKVLSGVDAGAFPAGTVFPVTASWPGGTASFDLPADGSVVASGLMLPEGTVVSLAEGDLPEAPEGYAFVSTSPSAASVTILAGGEADVAWSVTNAYARVVAAGATGGVDLQKQLVGVGAAGVPAGTVFTVRASWTVDGVVSTRDYALPADGARVTGPRDLPAGTVVTFAEVDVPRIDGYRFAHVAFSPASVTVEAERVVPVTAVNTYVGIGGSLPATGGTVPAVLVSLGVLLVLVGAATLLRRARRSAA